MAKGSTLANVFAGPTAALSKDVAASASESIEAKIARLEAENAALRAKKGGFTGGAITFGITDGTPWKDPKTGEMKPTTSGRIKLYGLQRMPLTLGVEQWQRLSEVLNGALKIRVQGSNGDSTFTFAELVAMADKAGKLSRKDQ